jgi:hypothetical protein
MEALPVHDDAHDVFMALPRHTSTREDEVQPVMSKAMRHPLQAWGSRGGALDQIGMHAKRNKRKRVILWRNYRLSAPCGREPRNVGDDFIRR